MGIIKTSKNSEKLREKAEKRLNTQIKDLDIPIDVKELIHELQVHQIELEIQNEELKSAQLKLQSSQGKYLDLYNFAPTAYFTLDDKEQIKDVNLAGVALLGLEKNSIIDKAFIRFIDHDSLNKFYKLIKKVIITNKIQKSDLNLLINLKSVPTHIEINSYNDINGNLKSFLITVSDMSELKKAELKLRESELEKSRMLYILNKAQEIAMIGSWVWDIKNNEVWWSDETYQIFGVSKEYIPTFESNKNFIHPDDLENYQKKFENSFKTGKALDFDLRIVTRLGDIKNCYVSGKIVYDSLGKPKRFIGNVMNITKRKKVENDLESSLIESKNLQNELATLIENIVDEVWFCDSNGNIVLANAAARKFEEKLKLEKVHSVDGLIKSVSFYDVDGKPRPREGSPLLRALNNEILKDFEEIVVFPSSGKKQFRQVSSAPIKNDKGEIVGAVAVVRDINKLKKADQEVKKSLQEKETLLKEIHHRVKNNMQIISSLLSLQTQFVDSDVAKVLEESQKRVKSMALVHEKLYSSQSFSRIDMGDYIHSLVSDLSYSYIFEDKIKIIIEIESIEFNIETAIPCGLIINELVSNSLKHAFSNERKGKINISLKSKSEQYELIVMDDGIGLPKDFELKNLDSLGLQLVNSLIHQLDGDMKIDRTIGTKFIITFRELEYKKRIDE